VTSPVVDDVEVGNVLEDDKVLMESVMVKYYQKYMKYTLAAATNDQLFVLRTNMCRVE
jgi:hypothetical protein